MTHISVECVTLAGDGGIRGISNSIVVDVNVFRRESPCFSIGATYWGRWRCYYAPHKLRGKALEVFRHANKNNTKRWAW